PMWSQTRVVCLLALLALRPECRADREFETDAAPFLKRHCVSCHGPDRQEAQVRLDRLTGVAADNRNLWTMVHEKVAADEMPPRSRPQPDEAQKKAFLALVARQQRTLGAGGTRRLNRRELSASLRDLTGLAVDFSAALPGDGTVAGFDTGADALQEASDSVAQWLLVTRRAVDGVRFLDGPKGRTYSMDLREVKD